jgi:hypothetical protein
VSRAVVLHVLACRPACRVRLVCVSSHAPSACASAAQAPCSWLSSVVFVVGFMSVLSLFVNCMSSAGQEMCECSTHQIAHPGSLCTH